MEWKRAKKEEEEEEFRLYAISGNEKIYLFSVKKNVYKFIILSSHSSLHTAKRMMGNSIREEELFPSRQSSARRARMGARDAIFLPPNQTSERRRLFIIKM